MLEPPEPKLLTPSPSTDVFLPFFSGEDCPAAPRTRRLQLVPSNGLQGSRYFLLFFYITIILVHIL